jgi:hypothetical protein
MAKVKTLADLKADLDKADAQVALWQAKVKLAKTKRGKDAAKAKLEAARKIQRSASKSYAKKKKEREKLKKEVEATRKKQRLQNQANLDRGEMADFLDEEGWAVYRFLGGLDWDASTEHELNEVDLEKSGGRVEPTFLADWYPVAGVWWRAEISLGYEGGNTWEEMELLEAINEGKQGRSLTRGEQKVGLEALMVKVRGGTKWHRDPRALDITIGTIVDNIQGKYGASPMYILITIYATSRSTKPGDISEGGA